MEGWAASLNLLRKLNEPAARSVLTTRAEGGNWPSNSRSDRILNLLLSERSNRPSVHALPLVLNEPSANLGTDRIPMKWGMWPSVRASPFYRILATLAELGYLALALMLRHRYERSWLSDFPPRDGARLYRVCNLSSYCDQCCTQQQAAVYVYYYRQYCWGSVLALPTTAASSQGGLLYT